ncbi:hypothetical protein M8494_04440 [Serratia ureilytica]
MFGYWRRCWRQWYSPAIQWHSLWLAAAGWWWPAMLRRHFRRQRDPGKPDFAAAGCTRLLSLFTLSLISPTGCPILLGSSSTVLICSRQPICCS